MAVVWYRFKHRLQILASIMLNCSIITQSLKHKKVKGQCSLSGGLHVVRTFENHETSDGQYLKTYCNIYLVMTRCKIIWKVGSSN